MHPITALMSALGVLTAVFIGGWARAVMAVRDRIHSGEIPGSRIFCAGNIVGLAFKIPSKRSQAAL